MSGNVLNMSRHNIKNIISFRTVERLWKITEELNILYKENWTALADREMGNFQAELMASAFVLDDEQVKIKILA